MTAEHTTGLAAALWATGLLRSQATADAIATHPAMLARDAALVQQGRDEGEATGAARVTAAVEADEARQVIFISKHSTALRESGGTDALAAREAAAGAQALRDAAGKIERLALNVPYADSMGLWLRAEADLVDRSAQEVTDD